MRSNPMIRRGLDSESTHTGELMSVEGVRNKTLLLVGITGIAAVATYMGFGSTPTGIYQARTFAIAASFAALFCAIGMMFSPAMSRVLSFVYAALQGVAVGGISLAYGYFFDGVIQKALTLTLLAVLFTLLLYKETPSLAGKIRKGVMILTFTIFGLSMIALIGSFLGMGSFAMLLFGSNPIAIGFSVLTVIVAIAHLMLDYDNVAMGVQHGLPKHMEYFFAVGILATVVWVYIEMVELLSRIAMSQE
ncbi:MAG: hypothetical protein ATN35_05670 [Epulopiscium sp. Nele67-Bin004]|nr:MAG: hypothetical protein ATN35_05670 [Epulopiscium sp. Nele67-Bin004]